MKRFDFDYPCETCEYLEVIESENGEYVLYEDAIKEIEKLKLELKIAKEILEITEEREVLDDMTKEYYPDKMDIEQFTEEVQDGICNFATNLKCIKNEKKYAEEWMNIFAAYMEMK